MDSDRDGSACDYLTRINRDILTVGIWQELLAKNIARKSATENKKALTYNEVVIAFLVLTRYTSVHLGLVTGARWSAPTSLCEGETLESW